MADDDLWHVRIAPDEVKILSLEKLDDLFRLEVIDADVLVWQPGMDEWLPLRVVAGIGDSEPEVVNINVSQPPPRPAAPVAATSWPPQAIPKQTATSWPPQASAPPPRSVAPAPRSLPPVPSVAPRAPSSVAPVSRASTASAWPPPAAWDPPSAPAPAVAAAQFPLYSTASPQIIDTDVRRPRRSGGAWLVAVALAAGAVVTLYRNAMVHAAAKSMGQESSYLNLETALGGPSFGTPRAVERMTESSRALAANLALVPEAPAPVKTSEPVATTPVATTTPAATTTSATVAQTSPAKAESPSSPATRPASAGPTRPVSASVRAPAPRQDPDPVFKTPKKKGKGNEFDPLNGNL